MIFLSRTPRFSAARFAGRLALAGGLFSVAVFTTVAEAQNRRAPTERELVAKINFAFNTLRVGNTDSGHKRLKNAARFLSWLLKR